MFFTGYVHLLLEAELHSLHLLVADRGGLGEEHCWVCHTDLAADLLREGVLRWVCRLRVESGAGRVVWRRTWVLPWGILLRQVGG